MKTKSINKLKSQDELKLTKQQMAALKGGDDDILINQGSNLDDLDFGG